MSAVVADLRGRGRPRELQPRPSLTLLGEQLHVLRPRARPVDSVEPVVERVRVGTAVRQVAPSTPPPAAHAADRDRLRLRLGSVGGLHACVRNEISEILRQHNQMAHGFGSEILTAVDGCFDDFSSAVQGIDTVRFELPTHSEESVGEDE